MRTESTTPPARSAARSLLADTVRLAAALTLVWLLLSTCTFVLALLVHGTMVRSSGFAWTVWIGPQALEWLLLAGLVAAAGWSIGGGVAVGRRWRHPAWVWTARAVVAGVVFVLLFLYFGSWALFRSTGVFLDWNGIVFLRNDLLQLLQHVAHMEAGTLVVVPLLIAGSTALALVGVPWLVRRCPTSLRLGVLGVGAVLLVACALGMTRADVIDPNDRTSMPHPVAGMALPLGTFYRECRAMRTGPLATAWADALRRRAVTPEGEGLPFDESIPVERRPIVSMNDYLAGIDSDRARDLNVLLVIVESLRPDQLQIFGGERPVMPALDELGRSGRSFARHYAQASHSNYADLCPMNSHYPLRTRGLYYYPKQPTYPRVLIYDILKARGYDTAIVSSQNEHWGGMLNYLDTGNLDHIFHAETFDGETYVPDEEEDRSVAVFMGRKRSGKIDDRITVDEAIRWIGERPEGRPWFAYLNLQNSHTPYVVPPDFDRPFGRDELPFVIRYNNYPARSAHLVKDRYADSLRYVDMQLGRLLAHLAEAGLDERTIVAVTGDTGEGFYEHGYAAHGNMLFDDQVRVPLIIAAPGLEPAIDDRPAQQIDIAPTVLDLLGLPPHPSFQGISLLAADPDPDRSLFMVVQSSVADQIAIVRGDYKLIHDYRRSGYALMNVRDDPGETVNLVDSEPGLTQRLWRRLGTWERLQLDYYADGDQHVRTYPPVLAD